MATRPEKPKQMTIDEFIEFAEADPSNRYELIEGYPIMMTGGSPDQAIIIGNIARSLGNCLKKRPCVVYSSDAYVVPDESKKGLYCPDASVSCDRRDHRSKKLIRYPSLIVEVHSPSTRRDDKGVKLDNYQDMPSVQEILYIDSQVLQVKYYHREVDGWFMQSFDRMDQTIALTSLEIDVPVTEIYEKTSFDPLFGDGLEGSEEEEEE